MKAQTNAKPQKGRHAKAASAGRHAARRTGKAPARRAQGKGVSLIKRALNDIRRVFGRRPGKPAKVRRPMNPANRKAALWLWCFPVGLSFMWRSGCTWRKGVKIGVTAAMAAVLVAILVFPVSMLPDARSGAQPRGVQMVADRPEVEVYGPTLPALIVPGYTKENTGSIIVDEVSSDVHYVYAADGARCYHEYECKFAFASSQRLTVYEAYYLGFEPCGRCTPPVYTPGVTDPITAEVIDNSGAAAASSDGEAAQAEAVES